MGGRVRVHRGGPVGADQGLTRLFYDGECGLCCGAVRLVARHDRSGEIRFAPLGGATFLRLIPASTRAGLPDSLVVLVPDGRLLLRTEALIHLLARMGGAWRLAGRGLAWFPEPLRELAYRLVARLRPSAKACAWRATAGDERFEP